MNTGRNDGGMEYWGNGKGTGCGLPSPHYSIAPALQHSVSPLLPMSWHRKHLLDIESLTVEEITTVLDTARAFKAVGERAIKKVPALRGKTVVNLFVEPSTRTRTSFE